MCNYSKLNQCSATCSAYLQSSVRSSDKGNSWCIGLVVIVTKWVFFGLIAMQLLSHQLETWSKLSRKVCQSYRHIGNMDG